MATCVYILFSGCRYGVWLGFHDMHQEGNYVTLSSGGGKICYSNWHRGEPNNYGKSEHCAPLEVRQELGMMLIVKK